MLNSIGVGHPNLDAIHSIAQQHGFACKLTGAGGGGCAIILLDMNTNQDQIKCLQNELLTKGFTSWKAVFGGEGVKILHCDSTFLSMEKT